MPVAWDERKRVLNLAKHGLDFALAEMEFDFAGALYPSARNERIKAIGLFDGRLCVLIFKPRRRRSDFADQLAERVEEGKGRL